VAELGHILHDWLYDWFGLNRALFRLINGMHGALWDGLMEALSTAADAANFPWYMAAVLLLARATPRLLPVQNAFVFGIGFPITSLIVAALKAATALPRPAVALGAEAVTLLDRQASGGSFPSSHVAHASFLAAALSPGAPRLLRGVLWLFVVLVAVSRLALGAHFPADAVGGAIVGTGVALVIRALLMYWGGAGRRAG
jgi:membrane-associated phospholipid phosphatase